MSNFHIGFLPVLDDHIPGAAELAGIRGCSIVVSNEGD